jgi:gamma-glutamylcyclotransferase (GGCT)/AIG2-like uncharacterized protein YtfP
MHHHPVFVYGTLMPGHHNHARCLQKRTTTETRAVINEIGLYRSQFLPYAAPAPGRHTHGYLMTLPDDTYLRTMHVLDQLEGYRPQEPPTHSHYIRTIRPAHFTDPKTGQAQSLQAWIYLAGPDIDITALRPIPAGQWTN